MLADDDQDLAIVLDTSLGLILDLSLSDAKFRVEALIVHEAYFGFGALESLQRGTFRSR